MKKKTFKSPFDQRDQNDKIDEMTNTFSVNHQLKRNIIHDVHTIY